MPVRNLAEETIVAAMEYEEINLKGEDARKGVIYWKGYLKYKGYSAKVIQQKATPYEGKYLVELSEEDKIDDFMTSYYTIKAAKEDFKLQIDCHISEQETEFNLLQASMNPYLLHFQSKKREEKSLCYRYLYSFIGIVGSAWFYGGHFSGAEYKSSVSIPEGNLCKKCLSIAKKKLEKINA